MSQASALPSNRHPAAEITVRLPDGKTMTLPTPATGGDVAAQIGAGLAKAALAVKLNGVQLDLSRELYEDGDIEIITRKSPEAIELIRHDCAHVLAEAVQTLFPGTQVTIGPNIDNGFFYDFARNQPFTPDDFEAIENKMREIIKRDAKFERVVWPRDKAIEHFKSIGENYKAEIIQDLPEDQTITVYKQGEWQDLCRGPHMPSTGHVGNAFKLMKG